MKKQIKWLITGGIAALILTGCGSSQNAEKEVKPGGLMPVPPPKSGTNPATAPNAPLPANSN